MGLRRERPKRLAAKLLAIRNHLGLSQRQLAQRLEVDNYTRLSEFERGRREPDLILLLRYVRLAKVRLADIIDDELELPF